MLILASIGPVATFLPHVDLKGWASRALSLSYDVEFTSEGQPLGCRPSAGSRLPLFPSEYDDFALAFAVLRTS